MALQVWLPFISDLRQQGIGSVSAITLTSGNELISGGKIGNKAIHLTKLQTILGTSSCMSGKKQMSWALWVKVNTAWETNWLDGIRWISTDGSTTHTSRQEFYTNCTYVGTWYQGGSISAKTFVPGEWTHLAATFDYESGKVAFYINGVLQGSTTNLDTTHYCRGDFYIGDNGVNIVENDVRIYDHCLSSMEVKELSKGLVLHYPLNRGGWGQENLYGHGSDLQTTLKGLNNYNNSFNIIEEDGKKCAHVSGALSTTKYLQSKLTFTPTVMEQFTFSAEVKIKNIIRGTTNPMCEFYFSGVTLDGAWRGFTVEYIKVDGQKVGATAIGFDRYLTDTAWHKVAVTAHFNYNGTSTIPALYPNIYLRDCTGDLYIRNVKLEKGPVATPWCPNSSDALATTIGLNGTTEYDTSGYCNNGVRTGTFSWTSDTPKYEVSTYMPKAALITHPRPVFGGVDQEWSCAVWFKLDNISQTSQYLNNFNLGNIILSSTTSLLYLNNGTNDYYMYGKKAITANEWTHIVFVFRNSDALRNVYINGELSNNYGPNKTSIPSGIPNTVIIGTNLAGHISDYRIYATALSADDVKSLYQNSAYIDSSGNVYGAVHSEV